jgi:hypothetical protein
MRTIDTAELRCAAKHIACSKRQQCMQLLQIILQRCPCEATVHDNKHSRRVLALALVNM